MRGALCSLLGEQNSSVLMIANFAGKCKCDFHQVAKRSAKVSIKVMDYVWEHSSQRGSGLLLLLAMADIANEDGDLYPSIARLAHKSRMSDRNTQLLMHKLELANEVKVFPELGLETEKGWTNLYRIVMPGTNDTLPLNSPAVSRAEPKNHRKPLTPKIHAFPEVVKPSGVQPVTPLADGVKTITPHVSDSHTITQKSEDGVKSVSPEPSVNALNANTNTGMSTFLTPPEISVTPEPPAAVCSVPSHSENNSISSPITDSLPPALPELTRVPLDAQGNEISPSGKKIIAKKSSTKPAKQTPTDNSDYTNSQLEKELKAKQRRALVENEIFNAIGIRPENAVSGLWAQVKKLSKWLDSLKVTRPEFMWFVQQVREKNNLPDDVGIYILSFLNAENQSRYKEYLLKIRQQWVDVHEKTKHQIPPLPTPPMPSYTPEETAKMEAELRAQFAEEKDKQKSERASVKPLWQVFEEMANGLKPA